MLGSKQRLALSLLQFGLQLAQVYVYRRIRKQHQEQIRGLTPENAVLKHSQGISCDD